MKKIINGRQRCRIPDRSQRPDDEGQRDEMQELRRIRIGSLLEMNCGIL
jgi:hypothetical protein